MHIFRQSAVKSLANRAFCERGIRQAFLLQSKRPTHVRSAAQVAPETLIYGGNGAPQSAYIHLPFCKRRCFYCDFPIQAIGSDANAPFVQNTMQQYVDTLCSEIEVTGVKGPSKLRTIFFGGGTPSLIPPHMLSQILDQINSSIGIDSEAEISMEADPGTFTKQSLLDYMTLGVNRFSIGIQAFQQDILEYCGRSHGLNDVYKAIEDVHQAGVENWSLDLISGLPYTDTKGWEASLIEGLNAGPSHISVYDLQVEDKTRFGRIYAQGQFPLPTDENTATMYSMASDVLRAGGMEHYEISSYAKPGFRCQHNLVYWGGAPYLAFGLGAASYIGRHRFTRPKTMRQYKAWVTDLEIGGLQPGLPRGAPLPPDEILLDTIMLRLRLADGLDLSRVTEEFGLDRTNAILRALRPHKNQGLVLHTGDTVRLSDPAGFLLSNDIISDIFALLDSP